MFVVVEAEDFADIPAWLRSEMERTHITGEEIAKVLGVSQSAVSQWRTGRNKMGADRLLKLVRLFGYRVELRRMYEVADV